MAVHLPHQGVGDLMQNGVGNVSLRRRPCIRLRQGDDSCIIVAAPPARLGALSNWNFTSPRGGGAIQALARAAMASRAASVRAGASGLVTGWGSSDVS